MIHFGHIASCVCVLFTAEAVSDGEADNVMMLGHIVDLPACSCRAIYTNVPITLRHLKKCTLNSTKIVSAKNWSQEIQITLLALGALRNIWATVSSHRVFSLRKVQHSGWETAGNRTWARKRPHSNCTYGMPLKLLMCSIGKRLTCLNISLLCKGCETMTWTSRSKTLFQKIIQLWIFNSSHALHSFF